MKKAIRVSGLPSCQYIPLHSGHSQRATASKPPYVPALCLSTEIPPTRGSPFRRGTEIKTTRGSAFRRGTEIKTTRGSAFRRGTEIKTTRGSAFRRGTEIKTTRGSPFRRGTEIKTTRGSAFRRVVESKKEPQVRSYLGAVALEWSALPLNVIQSSLYLWRPK